MEDFSDNDYYALLGVNPDCDFAVLKRAYYAAAKRCHPDRFSNSLAKTAEFQSLVAAFNCLSDPESRRVYDAVRTGRSRTAKPAPHTILDTEADDILEELIVGNSTLPESSLATLMEDLTKTEIFVTYREGCDHFDHGRYAEAEQSFHYIVSRAPGNLVFRVRLARAQAARRRWKAALYHYRVAVGLGKLRQPPQHMIHVAKELQIVREKSNPLIHWYNRLFGEKPFEFCEDSAEAMIHQLNTDIASELRRDPAAPARRLKK